MDYMEENPEIYMKILAKKKKEDAENGGVFSFLKVRLQNMQIRPILSYLS